MYLIFLKHVIERVVVFVLSPVSQSLGARCAHCEVDGAGNIGIGSPASQPAVGRVLSWLGGNYIQLIHDKKSGCVRGL